MYVFYLTAVLLFGLGLLLWHFSEKITAKEMFVGSGVGLLLAIVFHAIAHLSAVNDYETISTNAAEITYEPAWTECVTTVRTDGRGRSQTETYYRHHPEEWMCQNADKSSFEISFEKYGELASRFSGAGSSRQSSYRILVNKVSGDNFRYSYKCPRSLFVPTTMSRWFSNRIAAGPSAFSFAHVDPNDKTIPDYPENTNHFVSRRIIGRANGNMDITDYDWDSLNSRVGPSKHVNLTLVGFGSESLQDSAHRLRAKWLGGKKNDLVLCFGGSGLGKWSYVFGWSEAEVCKAALQTILLDNTVDAGIIPKIEEEVVRSYVPRDWADFDYISIEPKPRSIVVFLLTIVAAQVACYVAFFRNDETKSGRFLDYRRGRFGCRR